LIIYRRTATSIARSEQGPLRRLASAAQAAAALWNFKINMTLPEHPSLIARNKPMDWNRIEGSWKQTTGKIKEKWGKLTDDDLTQINGKREQFEGKIQERYGIAKDQVRKNVDTWLNSLE
jgi:uncharacterized protein YjbJ (UPF0337 family)